MTIARISAALPLAALVLLGYSLAQPEQGWAGSPFNIWIVNTTDDGLDGLCDGPGVGQDCTLREAMEAAANDGTGSEVRIPTWAGLRPTSSPRWQFPLYKSAELKT